MTPSKKKHSWHQIPHPGPDPSRTKTLKEILTEMHSGTLLSLSQGRIPPMATPRTHERLLEDLAEILVQGEVFKRIWWSLAVELRDLVWRLLDTLYKEGGWVEFEDLAEKPTMQELDALQTAGLVFSLPSPMKPKHLAFPYEYFFMPDMPGTGPQSLCQGMRHYSESGARVLATELGLRTNAPRAQALALLHRRILENSDKLTHEIAPVAASILTLVASHGGMISARALSAALAAQRPEWALRLPLSADDLVGARFSPNGPAQLLARRALLIPCGEPGWSAFPQVVIPEELREAACGPVLAQARQELARERRKLAKAIPEAAPDARPGEFATDLRRFALATHIEKMEAARSGRLSRSDFRRLSLLMHLGEDELEVLVGFASRAGGPAEPLGGVGLETFLAYPPARQQKALSDDYFGPAGWLRDFRRHLVSVLEAAREGWVATEALAKYLVKDPQALQAYESCHAGEAGPAESTWIKARVAEDLRMLHRYGFLERATGAPVESWRLAASARWALHGIKPPAAALRAPRSAPAAEAGFAVLPTLEILASPTGGAEMLTALARIARLERADSAFVFRIDKKSLALGLNSGMSIKDIREFLEEHSRNPLPETVRALLRDLSGGDAEVSFDAKSRLLKVKDPMVLLKLRRVKWLRPWLIEGAPEGALRLTPEADGAGLAARLAEEGFILGRTT